MTRSRCLAIYHRIECPENRGQQPVAHELDLVHRATGFGLQSCRALVKFVSSELHLCYTKATLWWRGRSGSSNNQVLVLDLLRVFLVCSQKTLLTAALDDQKCHV